MRLLKSRFSVLLSCTLLCFATSTRRVCAQGCPGSGTQSTGPDVIVGTIGQIQGSQQITNIAADATWDALSVGTTSCNLGNSNLLWEQSPDTDHPVITQNLYRLKQVDGTYRYEQVGQSWLKHAFTALAENACCSTCNNPGTGSRLGVGCSDPYTASRNAGQGSLGPKWQVNATTGIHIHPVANPSFSGVLARRLRVRVADLENSTTQTAATRYFVECQYVAVDDAANGNKNNNASWRQVSAAFSSGTNFTFGYFGSNPNTDTHRQEPGILAWKNFDPTVTVTNIITPENANANPNLTVARALLAVQATDLGNGTYHYEYALQNLNSDRSIYSFSVPLPTGATITNIGFHDVDYMDGDGSGNTNEDGTDWPGVVSANAITWACTQTSAQNVNANALRWSSLYNFRFDADVAPVTGDATLVQFKPGAQTLSVSTLVPNAPVVPACACLGDINGSTRIDADDIQLFVDMYVQNTTVSDCADIADPKDGVLNTLDVKAFVLMLIGSGDCE